MGVKILSLYDGMACGMIAMQLAGVDVESYDAYEIDKYAIKTAQHNFPMIKEHGDVFEADFTQYEGVDFGIGGSPCTHWSIAQTKNRETTVNRDSKGNILLHQSGIGVELFSQFLRMLSEAKPKFFIYENNKSMSKEIRAAITECFGFEPTEINSALVSAQNRQRLYWVGKRNEDGTYSKVNVEQPADRGILLKDVLDNAVARDMVAEPINTDANGKAFCVTSRYYKGFGNNPGKCLEKHRDSMAAEPVRGMGNDTKSRTLTANYWKTNVRDAFVDCAGGRTMAAEPINVTANGKSKTISASYAYKGDGEGSLKSELFPDNPIKQTSNYVAEPINMTADGKSQTLKAQYCKNNVANFCCYSSTYGASGVAEPVCLRYERTEEAKRCRKAYEAHEIKHGYNELNELHPRPDGKTNTLTTVLKDNQIMEPVCVAERGRMYRGQPQHYEARTDGKTNTLTSVEKDNRVAEPISYCTDKNIEHLMRNFGSKGKIVDEESKTPTLMAAAGMGGGNHIYYADLFAEPINMTADGKAQCLRATCYKDGIRNIVANDVDKKTGVAEPINDIYQCANGGGAGAKTGLYAVPYDCDVVITENSIRCQRRDQKHSTVQGSHVNFTDGKTQTLSPSHIPNVIEPKSCGDLYAIPTMPVKEATAKGYTEIECGDCVDLSMPNSKTRRGRSMANKANCMQTSNEFYQYVGYVIEFDDDGRPIKAIGKDGKEITIYEVKDGKITIKGKQYPIKLKDGFYIIRKLTVSECKRLQTVPEWYEFPVSNTQAYKMLGNGWTCEVIAHLIRSCNG